MGARVCLVNKCLCRGVCRARRLLLLSACNGRPIKATARVPCNLCDVTSRKRNHGGGLDLELSCFIYMCWRSPSVKALIYADIPLGTRDACAWPWYFLGKYRVTLCVSVRNYETTWREQTSCLINGVGIAGETEPGLSNLKAFRKPSRGFIKALGMIDIPFQMPTPNLYLRRATIIHV